MAEPAPLGDATGEHGPNPRVGKAAAMSSDKHTVEERLMAMAEAVTADLPDNPIEPRCLRLSASEANAALAITGLVFPPDARTEGVDPAGEGEDDGE